MIAVVAAVVVLVVVVMVVVGVSTPTLPGKIDDTSAVDVVAAVEEAIELTCVVDNVPLEVLEVLVKVVLDVE
jgi:hypothetical protein